MPAVVTCLFNPCGWQSRVRNYERFAEGMRAAGCTLYCVELCYNDEVPVCSADVKINLRGDARHILWQKEALLAVGLARAAAEGHKILACLDADVLVPPTWGRAVCKAVNGAGGNIVLQAASHWLRGFSGGGSEAWQSLALNTGKPFVGGGWAARCEFWRSFRLFDLCVVGGGDWALAEGFSAACGRPLRCPWPNALTRPALREAWMEWRGTLPRLDGVAAVPAEVKLLPHGTRQDRNYNRRLKLLDGFDPLHDVRRRADGVLEWTGTNPAMEAGVLEYFLARKEDD